MSDENIPKPIVKVPALLGGLSGRGASGEKPSAPNALVGGLAAAMA